MTLTVTTPNGTIRRKEDVVEFVLAVLRAVRNTRPSDTHRVSQPH